MFCNIIIISGIIEVFGVETILIYTALLLKKKIAVYFPPHSIQDLLQFTRQVTLGNQKISSFFNFTFEFVYISITERGLFRSTSLCKRWHDKVLL